MKQSKHMMKFLIDSNFFINKLNNLLNFLFKIK